MSIGLFSLFFFLIYCYALNMNQFAVIRLCFVIPFLLTAVISPTPLYAQRKVPRKIFKKSPAPRIDKIVGEFITPAELRALQKGYPSAKAIIEQTQYQTSNLPQNLREYTLNSSAAQYVEHLANRNPNPMKSLKEVWGLQQKYEDNFLFEHFVRSYYNRYFFVLTPHLKELFHKVAFLNKPNMQRELVNRIYFMAQNKAAFRDAFAPNCPKKNIRLRYLHDISKIQSEGFIADMLVFSFERKMSPGQKDAVIRHVHAGSVFQAGKKSFSVYEFDGDLIYLPFLYLYLVTGYSNARVNNPVTVYFNKKDRSLGIYNHDKSLWLRITPHEYKFPEKIHLHLNETQTATIHTKKQVLEGETVNFNLSIPLARPKNLPKHRRDEFLYQSFVLNPVQVFRTIPNVKVIER